MVEIVPLTKREIAFRPETQFWTLIYGGIFPSLYFTSAIDELYLKFLLIISLFLTFLAYFSVGARAELRARLRFRAAPPRLANWALFRRRGASPAIERVAEQRLADGSTLRIAYHNHKKYYVDSAERFVALKPSLKRSLGELVNVERPFVADPRAQSAIDENALLFPLPELPALLRQQLSEPMQLFQIFSALLWVFDSGVYQPLFMLTILFGSNLSACVQRLATVLNLRELRTPAYWVEVRTPVGFERRPSTSLRPGDVVIVRRTAELVSAEATGDAFAELRARIPLGAHIPTEVLERMFGAQRPPSPQHSADLLLRSGSAVVDESALTGESLPQAKSALAAARHDETFSAAEHRSALLFAGCDVLAVGAPGEAPPEAVVLATGFDTAKGRVARAVLAGDEPTVEGRRDAYILLGLLLCVALVTSIYVLLRGLADPTRDRNKLFLRCIAIVTNVVPPELPMVMGMAISSAVTALRRKRIFCTEPQRLPAAGRVRTCVFDKTGTLTEERLTLCGWADAEGEVHSDWTAVEAALPLSVLLGCHSLFEFDGRLTGDPVERLLFECAEFSFNARERVARGGGAVVAQRRTFAFSPELRRMAVVAEVRGSGPSLLVKGAPEAIIELLAAADVRLAPLAAHLAAEGFRVLGLATRSLTNCQIAHSREELERELTFAGFLLLRNELKPDSAARVQRLLAAKRRVVMLTGDHVLTSARAFSDLAEGPPLFLAAFGPRFQRLNGVEAAPPPNARFALLADDAMRMLASPVHADVLARAAVIARANPVQKEQFVRWLQRDGPVLMSGAGTYDAGALRAAAVGVALVGCRAPPSRAEKLAARAEREAAVRRAIAERRLPRREELEEAEAPFKLGDASIAAPFTSKHSNSIKCVEVVMRQGLSTLVSGLQSYKTATLSSLMLAYSLSSLHLHNLRFSDSQNLALGVYGTYLYFVLSNGRPVRRLPAAAPEPGVFGRFFWLSLLGQAAIQLTALRRVFALAVGRAPPTQLALNNEKEFVPTLLNTCMFLFELSSVFAVWAFNHEGRPFMQSLSETRHFKLLIAGLALIPLLALDVWPELGAAFSLRFDALGGSVGPALTAELVALLVGSFVWTRFVVFLRMGRLEKWV